MNLFFLIATFLWSTILGEDPIKPSDISGNIELRSMVVATRFDSLFRSLSTKGGFNGNVLIGMSGNIVYKNAFGFSNLKTKEPLNVKSVFQIASVSKQFTAIAIMMLQERGQLEYSDSVQKFLPDFPYKNITIKQLLSHRSGLPNYMYFTAKYWKKKKEFLTNERLLEIMVSNKPRPEFLPDRRYKYSNTGYAMLALIVERLSGKPYDVFMEENVFHPLGMTSTFVYNPLNKKTNEYETNGYNRNHRKSYEDFLDGVCGDKGIHSTVEDMFLWDQALYSERLVKQTTLNEAFTPVSYDYKRDNNYGYGFRIDTLADGSKIVYHGGWWRGYNSLFVRRLDDHSTIIILCNKVNWGFGDIEDLMSIIDLSKM
ncbi:MAG: serine hydrolase domain-containing protein [Bacteroidota bacterium]|nr:serine hydrolase domain-containing protein [Bacteroidota bacterium]